MSRLSLTPEQRARTGVAVTLRQHVACWFLALYWRTRWSWALRAFGKLLPGDTWGRS